MAIPTDSFVKVQSADTPTKEITSIRKQPNVSYHTIGAIVADVVAAANVSATGDFDTVASMKAGTLAHNDIARTKGYTAVGDGGLCVYKITDDNPGGVEHVITLNNGKYATAQFNGATVPQQWGVVHDASGSAAANVTALNAMFQYQRTHLCVVHFLGGDYYVNDTITLPTYLNVGNRIPEDSYVINFNSAVLRPTVADKVVLQRPEVSAAESGSLKITNLTVNANSQSGCTGLQIISSFSSLVSGCHFIGLATGLDLQFGLATHVEGTRFTSCLLGTNCRNTVGAGSNNKQSNRTKFDNCRWYAPNNSSADYQLRVEHSSGINVVDCIFEGHHTSEADIYVDATATTVKDISIQRVHVESVDSSHSGDNVFLEVDGSGGGAPFVKVIDIYQQDPGTPGRTMVKATACQVTFSSSWYQDIKMENIGSKWDFPDRLKNYYMIAGTPQIDWDTSGSGTIPTALHIEPDLVDLHGISSGRGWSLMGDSSKGTYSLKSYINRAEYEKVYDGDAATVASNLSHFKISWNGSYFISAKGSGTGAVRHFSFFNDVGVQNRLYLTNGDNVDDGAGGTTITRFDHTYQTNIHHHPQYTDNYMSLNLPGGNNYTGTKAITFPNATGDLTAYTGTAAPAHNGTGAKGEIRYNGGKVYICVDTDTWVRIAADTSW